MLLPNNVLLPHSTGHSLWDSWWIDHLSGSAGSADHQRGGDSEEDDGQLLQEDAGGLHKLTQRRNVRLKPKVCPIVPLIGQIRDFFTSNFSTFWLGEPKCTEIWSEKGLDFYHLGPVWINLGSIILGLDIFLIHKDLLWFADIVLNK